MRITFFNFATFNYGGGCEKNFLKLGLWLSNRHKISFISGSLRMNSSYCKIANLLDHEQNIINSELRNKYAVKLYLKFDLIDLLLPTKKRKSIKKILNQSDIIYTKNEIFEIVILRFFFGVNPKKILVIFQSPLYYPISKSIRSKIHNCLYGSKLYGALLVKSKKIVLTNESKKRLLNITKDNQIKLIPNPIDTSFFNRKNYKKGKKFKVYYIGRMTEQKGVDVIYEVINILSKRNYFKNFEFFFVGRGDKEKYLHKLSKKYKNCHYVGFKSNILHYYHDADILIAPSRWEGFPHVLLESHSCGVPVITSNSEGCKEIVLHKKTGWVCEMDKISQFVSSLEEAFEMWHSNFKQFVGMGIMARERIVENWDKEKINKKIERFLKL